MLQLLVVTGRAMALRLRRGIDGRTNARGVRVAYYMRARTHLALGKDVPITRPVMPPSIDRIVATSQVGGLHRYDRAAA